MTKLQFINTSHPKYKFFKEQYDQVIQSFKQFLVMKKMKRLDVSTEEVSIKGAPTEYPRFLLFALIQYSDIHNDNEINCELIEIAKKVESVTLLNGFREFNLLKKQQGHYSSAISYFKEFVDFTAELLMLKQETPCVYLPKEIITGPTIRKEAIQTEQGLMFTRNLAESMQAKIRANWMCELNGLHETFISQLNNKPYVEAHHIIPISVQMDFEYTIDFAENIIVLCPTCHRKIHYGKKVEIKGMLDWIFKQRGQKYKGYGIEINLSQLYKYYGI